MAEKKKEKADDAEAEQEEEEEEEQWTPRLAREWEAIQYAPDKYKENREFMLRLLRRPGAGYAHEFMGEELREDTEDLELMFAAIKTSDGEAFKWCPTFEPGQPSLMHRNRDFMLKCISVNAEVLRSISNKVKNDNGKKSKSIKGIFYCNQRAGSDDVPFKTGICNPTGGAQCESCSRILDDPDNCPLPQDRDFFMKALQLNWKCLKFADKELQGEKDIVMQAVRTGGWAIQYSSEELRADEDVAKAAVEQNWEVFRILNKRLRSNRDIAQAALKQDWHAFKLMTKDLRTTDKELCMEVVEQSWQSFEFLGEKWLKDRDLALKAVTQNWQAFKHVSNALKNDRELALIAVRQHGEALALVAEPLKADREIVLKAVRQNWRAVLHADPARRADKDMMLELVQVNGFALRHAVEDLKSDPDLVAAAMEEQWASVDAAVQPLFPKEDGLCPAFWLAHTEESGLKGTKFKPAVPLLPLQ